MPDLAWDQFLPPFDHQDESGALPDSVTHSEVLYNFVKPPIHGWALRQLRRRLPQPGRRARLAEVYGGWQRWTAFWLDHRRAPGQRAAPLPARQRQRLGQRHRPSTATA